MGGEDNVANGQQVSQQPDLSLRLSLGSLYCGEKNSTATSAGKALSLPPETTSAAAAAAYRALPRSFSLPVESEKRMIMEELRELRVVRRMVAKQRTAERQRNCRVVSFAANEKAPPEVTLAVPAPETLNPSEMAAWAAASATQSAALARAICMIKAQLVEGHEDLSAGNKTPSAMQTLPEQRNKQPAFAPQPIAKGKSVEVAENEDENPAKKAKVPKGVILGNGVEVITRMPSVSCTGDGPNGRRIEGFLYKYSSSHVILVCICHGSFHSPEEFVRHAGGNDVENPMRRISVMSTPFPY